MDEMVEDDFGKDFMDVGQAAAVEDQDFGQDFTDLETQEKDIEAGKPTWTDTINDILLQSERGALRLFTWPADVLKAGMIGSALSGIDELEEEFERAGKPFDREKLTKSVYNTAEFFPTQDSAEKWIESRTGESFAAKTELGKKVEQAVNIAGLARGGVVKKALSGATAAGVTYGLEQAGVPGAGVMGDIVGLAGSAIKKSPRQLTTKASESARIAQKYALPFLEYQAMEYAPFMKGKLFQSTENSLKREFNVSTKQALDKILTNEIPIKALRDSGINLDVLAEQAYTYSEVLADSRPQVIKTDQIVKAIDQEIAHVRSLAPSPSTAEKAAINILENERDILKVSNPTSSQVIKQYKNYNENVKGIYRKPEFSGVEKEVKNAYGFLNNQLVTAMEHQGHSDVANSFKEANKIFHAKSKLEQTESILSKAFTGEEYSAAKLDKILASNKGKFLERNLGRKAVNDIKEIAKYGTEAQSNINHFIKLKSPYIEKEIGNWGMLAPFVYMPDKLTGGLLSIAKPLAERIQGKLLTRNGLRETYKMTLKHAAEGQYQLLKKDFFKLEEGIAKEWGDVETFIDATMQELQFDGFE